MVESGSGFPDMNIILPRPAISRNRFISGGSISLGQEAERAAGGPVNTVAALRRTRADRESARWRTVRDVEKIEEYLDYAYSDLDFFVG